MSTLSARYQAARRNGFSPQEAIAIAQYSTVQTAVNRQAKFRVLKAIAKKRSQ